MRRTGFKALRCCSFRRRRSFQVRLNTSADVQHHWEVHTVGLVADSAGSDKVINVHVEAKALEHMVGEVTM